MLWRNLGAIALIWLIACAPAGQPGEALDPPLVSVPGVNVHVGPWSVECHFAPQSCITPPATEAPEITEQNELCPSFFHSATGDNPILLASTAENMVEWVYASGDKRTVELPMDGLPDDSAVVYSTIQAAQSFVAVSRQWNHEDPQGSQVGHYALTVLNIHTEQVIWHRVHNGEFLQEMWLHADGSLVFNKVIRIGNSHQYGVGAVNAYGTLFESMEFRAEGSRAGVTDSIPVRSHSNELGWWSPIADTFLLVAQDQQTWNAKLVNDHWIWIQQGKTSPWLMIAAPGEEASIEPVSGLPNSESLYIAQATAPRWLLLSDGQQDWRIELKQGNGKLFVSGQAMAIQPEIPEDMLALDGCFSGTKSLDSQGRLLFFLRDDTSTTAYRFDPEDEELVTIGDSVYGGMGGTIINAVNTYHVHNFTMNHAFCMPPGWTPDLMVPSGPSHQIALPDMNTTFTLGGNPYTEPISMHYTGMCFSEVLYDNEGAVAGHRVIDAYNGKQTEISLLGEAIWLH